MRHLKVPAYVVPVFAIPLLALMRAAAVGHRDGPTPTASARSAGDTVVQARYLVLSHGCADCHGSFNNPANEGWMAGETGPEMAFMIGA